MIETFHSTIQQSLKEEKITSLTEVQKLAIPLILNNKSTVILAETGSGKTLSYLIPIIEQTIGLPKKNIKVLIVTATKELCDQITKVCKSLTRHNQLLSMKIIGGENLNEQVRDINKGQHIIISTPGRLKDLIEKESIDLSHVDTVVLDEADILMDMGYLPQIEVIMQSCQNRLRTHLVSATMSEEAEILIKQFLNSPERIHLNENKPKAIIEEIFCSISSELKIPFLKFLIKEEKIKSALVFCNTREDARELFSTLIKDNYKASLIEGEMSTHQRKKALESLKSKTVKILIATDVASRGIDISHLTHVINYEVPLNLDSYVHRIGRTARYLNNGKAITLYDSENVDEVHNLKRIKSFDKPTTYKAFNYLLKLPKNKKKSAN